jgi:hypothetical protein
MATREGTPMSTPSNPLTHMNTVTPTPTNTHSTVMVGGPTATPSQQTSAAPSSYLAAPWKRMPLNGGGDGVFDKAISAADCQEILSTVTTINHLLSNHFAADEPLLLMIGAGANNSICNGTNQTDGLSNRNGTLQEAELQLQPPFSKRANTILVQFDSFKDNKGLVHTYGLDGNKETGFVLRVNAALPLGVDVGAPEAALADVVKQFTNLISSVVSRPNGRFIVMNFVTDTCYPFFLSLFRYSYTQGQNRKNGNQPKMKVVYLNQYLAKDKTVRIYRCAGTNKAFEQVAVCNSFPEFDDDLNGLFMLDEELKYRSVSSEL